MLKAGRNGCLCTMPDRVQESRRPPPVTCWLVVRGWHLHLICFFFYQWTTDQFILSVRLLVVFVWQVRDGLCLFGSQCLFDHWGIPGISWRGSPLHGRIGRLLVHRRIHFQVIKWIVANYFGFKLFWHSTIIAMSFPLHKFDMSVRSNIVGCTFWQSYYICIRSWFWLRPILILSGWRSHQEKDWTVFVIWFLYNPTTLSIPILGSGRPVAVRATRDSSVVWSFYDGLSAWSVSLRSSTRGAVLLCQPKGLIGRCQISRQQHRDEYIYTHKRNNSAAEVVAAATTT